MKNKMLCRVMRRSFDRQDLPAVMMAVENLMAYRNKAFCAGRLLLADEQQK